MSTRRYSSEYKALRPFIIEEIRGILGGSVAVAGAVGGIASHALNDTSIHTGQLAQTQAPWASTKNELATHAANPDAHHAKQHVLATNTGLGADHTISGAVAGWVLKATASNAARMAQLLVTDLGATGANWDVAALTAANTVGLRTPSSDVRTGAAEALLKSNAAGELGLKGLAVGSAMILSGSGNIAAYPDIQFTGDALLAAEGSLYVSLDSDNNLASGAALVVGHNSSTTTGFQELFRVNDLGEAIVQSKVRVPLLDTASGHLTVQPAVDLLLNPGSSLVKLQSGVALQSHNYASQTTGVRISAVGEGDFRYIYTDEMHAKAFIADLEQALAGGQIISKSVTLLAQDFTVPAAGGNSHIYVRDLPSAPGMAVFESGDIIRLRQFSRAGGSLTIANAWLTVGSYVDQGDGTQRWNVTRSSGSNAGTMAAGAVLAKDLIVLDYGKTGNGFYEVNAIDGLYAANSPYLQFVRWTGHPATGQAVRLRAGQLRGVFSQDEFGIFAGTGTGNDDRWLRLSDYAAGNGINNLPFRMYSSGVEAIHFGAWNDVWLGTSSADKRISWDGAVLSLLNGGSPVITFDNAGASYFAGVMTIGAAGEIRQGTGALGSDYTGLRIWRESNVGRIAGYNANALQWYADTDGRFKAGGGAVVIDATGMWLQVALAQHKLRFMDGTATLGYVEGFADLNHNLRIAVGENSGKGGSFVMQAYNGANTLLASLGVGASGVTVTGDLRLSSGFLRSSAAFAFTNLAGTVYQDITVKNLSLTNNGIYSTAAIVFLTAASAAQSVYAGGLLVSSAYAAHASRVPTNGIYSLGGITTSGGISSYADDLYIARAGTSKLGLFDWGTYAYGSLTLDDILNIAAVQATEPAAPANGVKLYLINRSGVIKLEAKFANGHVKPLADNT